MNDRWYVRTWFREGGELVQLDEGPFDLWFAEAMLAEIALDASVARGHDFIGGSGGRGRVTVERAKLVPVEIDYSYLDVEGALDALFNDIRGYLNYMLGEPR